MSDEAVRLAEIAYQEKALTLQLQSRERIWLAVIAALATLSTSGLNYLTVKYSAAEVKTELTSAKELESQDRAVLKAGSKASVLSWKAYDTKNPDDKELATQAVVNAERLTETMPPPRTHNP